ncbi:DUF4011 domain-containing protein [Tsukamurella soli]|uniref:DUF4011 domain-containing protein n=1 Tax=Tsukamurella soli TaxID=644556 RepID=UPI00360996AB
MTETSSRADDQTATGLTIDVDAFPAVNLALIHNRVPLIRRITVSNGTPTPIHDLRVTASLTGLLDGQVPAWSETIDRLGAGASTHFEMIREVDPSRAHLSALTESYPAGLVVAATTPDRVTAVRVEHPIQVLAHNEWFADPVFYESLATFVQPNTAAVSSILDEASRILADQTGDASIQGYQSGPNRAGLIAAAVYGALVRRDIRYINPPASFEKSGQKVRTPQQVLDERFGTCIDLAVTYAACLEQAGLHPHVWVIDGHAFAGFMRYEATIGAPVVLEPNTMLNLAESGDVVVVEAQFYQSGTPSLLAAVEVARRHLNDPRRLRGLIDIKAARDAGIRPLPGVATPTTPAPEAEASAAPSRVSLALPDQLASATSARPGDEQIVDDHDSSPARVKKWKRALLDLSTRNRLLNLRASREVLYLVTTEQSLPMLDDLVESDRKVTLLPADDLSSMQKMSGTATAADLPAEAIRDHLAKRRETFVTVPEARYASVFKGLQRAARTLLEETGNSNLYLTFGSLVHATTSGTEARAPLFLLPVQLTGGTGQSRFQIVMDSTTSAAPNYCLIEWLRVKHNVTIEALKSPPTDDNGIDVSAALTGIRQALLRHNLPFRVAADATVSICRFGTLGMWQDIQDSWEILERSPLVHHLTHSAGDTFVDPDVPSREPISALTVDETAQVLPIAYDGSQLRAIEASAAGRTFVLEGPPGTGKSQTITNLIARNLAAGRTVLFVAEKQAALDVVRRRLERVGLAPFTLDLHGQNQTSANIREQLKRSLDHRATFNDGAWDSRLATWRAQHSPLAAYPRLIHAPNAVGDSLWRAADTVAAQPGAPFASLPNAYVSTTSPGDATAVRDALRTFGRMARAADTRRDNPWRLADDPGSDEDIEDAWRTATAALQQFDRDPNAARIIGALRSPLRVAVLLGRIDDEVKAPAISDAVLAESRSPAWAQSQHLLLSELSTLRSDFSELTRSFNPVFIAAGDPAALAQLILDSRRGMGKRKKAERAVAALRAVTMPNADLTLEQAVPLLQNVPSARSLRDHVRQQATELLGDLLPEQWDPLSADAERDLHAIVGNLASARSFADRYPVEWQMLRKDVIPGHTRATLTAVVTAWREWTRVLGASDASTARWLRGRDWMTTWRAAQPQWSDDLAQQGTAPMRRLVDLDHTLAPLRASGLTEFAEMLMVGAIPAVEGESRYLSGVARASIAERVAANGLQSFSTQARDGQTADYAAGADRVRDDLQRALPAQLIARRPFSADRLEGDYGTLRRSLDQKRNARSVRTLVQRYGREIVSATPCFLVSPSSLAQFVAPGSVTFDLVVFDEASQVTVAQSIGALGRARSAVIVGDSKQMPPTTVGMASTDTADDEDEEAAESPEDLDSILTECVESGVERLWLTWHYRSQDESLIAFSNESYYDGRLASLPSPGGDDRSGIEVRKVPGHFNRENTRHEFRTNRVEAEAIVAEITRLVSPPRRERSIGVVTFNRQQQELIQLLLDECDDPAVADLLRPDVQDGLFVKNLENVQGDERDLILFSTAFSKRPGEDRMPLNFGPLTNSGGERRLNVAITRARRKVVVFTSFSPSDIDVSRTKSAGIRDLKKYMEAAQAGFIEQSDRRRSEGAGAIETEIAHALRARGSRPRTITVCPTS